MDFDGGALFYGRATSFNQICTIVRPQVCEHYWANKEILIRDIMKNALTWRDIVIFCQNIVDMQVELLTYQEENMILS